MTTKIKTKKTSEVRIKNCKFYQSPRIQALAKRSRELALSGKRKLTGFVKTEDSDDFSYGDHACWIDIGPFPKIDQMPSKVNGYEASGESWGRDYAFLMDNSPIDIYENERIVGEIHWEMHMVRQYEWPDSVLEIVKEATDLGEMPVSYLHTSPDLSIGLSLGWGGILENINKNREKYINLGNKARASYLHGLQMMAEANIRFISRYAEKARELAKKETDSWQKETYEHIAESCSHIAENPPRTYYEGVQWIHFAVLLDRSGGHGNGYGRLDCFLMRKQGNISLRCFSN